MTVQLACLISPSCPGVITDSTRFCSNILPVHTIVYMAVLLKSQQFWVLGAFLFPLLVYFYPKTSLEGLILTLLFAPSTLEAARLQGAKKGCVPRVLYVPKSHHIP